MSMASRSRSRSCVTAAMLLLLLGAATAAASQAGVAQEARESALVQSLPGWAGPLPSPHYSGYLPVDGGTKMLHYYLQEADTGARDKPLVLWMNGGPGASSLIGAFEELGQLVFNRDSAVSGGGPPELKRNPYSWTTAANVLYLEAPAGSAARVCPSPARHRPCWCTVLPVKCHLAGAASMAVLRAGMLQTACAAGVGFSYCVDSKSQCVNNDTSTASDNHDALVAFLSLFPEYVRHTRVPAGATQRHPAPPSTHAPKPTREAAVVALSRQRCTQPCPGPGVFPAVRAAHNAAGLNDVAVLPHAPCTVHRAPCTMSCHHVHTMHPAVQLAGTSCAAST